MLKAKRIINQKQHLNELTIIFLKHITTKKNIRILNRNLFKSLNTEEREKTYGRLTVFYSARFDFASSSLHG
jgi:hypothetical protein